MIRLPVSRPLAWAGLALIAVGGVCTSAPIWSSGILPDDNALVAAYLGGSFVSLSALFVLCVWLRCQRCSYRLFWHAVSRRAHPGGLAWFMTETRCPACGHSRATPDL